MKRLSTNTSGQFTLALHREPIPHLDAAIKEELLKALADLLLEALGAETGEHQIKKEESNESEDYV